MLLLSVYAIISYKMNLTITCESNKWATVTKAVSYRQILPAENDWTTQLKQLLK